MPAHSISDPTVEIARDLLNTLKGTSQYHALTKALARNDGKSLTNYQIGLLRLVNRAEAHLKTK